MYFIFIREKEILENEMIVMLHLSMLLYFSNMIPFFVVDVMFFVLYCFSLLFFVCVFLVLGYSWLVTQDKRAVTISQSHDIIMVHDIKRYGTYTISIVAAMVDVPAVQVKERSSGSSIL